MANIEDYLVWRGDVPFSLDPFNAVDNLVLSELSYIDFHGVLPENGPPMPISTVTDRFFKLHSEEEILANTAFTRLAPFLLKKMAGSRRFGRMTVARYIDEVDVDKEKQISAMTFYPGDGTAYIAFRGTDDTIVGWKEDFMLSYKSGTAGQLRAVKYINEVFSEGTADGGDAGRDSIDSEFLRLCPIRVGGHSKGGNFAIYAAAFCDESIRKRIEHVYSNDGPGFRVDVLTSPGFLELLPRMTCIVPDGSMIGMMMDNAGERVVVKSSNSGVMQHDALSWEVYGNRFVTQEELSETGLFWEHTIRTWIEDVDDKTRESWVDSLFAFFETTGKDTLSGIRESRLQSFMEMTELMRDMSEDKRKEFLDILMKLVSSGGKTMAMQINENRKERTRRLAQKGAAFFRKYQTRRAKKEDDVEESGEAHQSSEGSDQT